MILNQTKQTRLSGRTFFARRMIDRVRGMIGRKFDSFDAMVFPDCSAIHTFFMSMPIDVVFVDRENTVVKTCCTLRPWRPFIWAPRAVTVIELPAGTLKKIPVAPGEKLEFAEENMIENETVPAPGRPDLSRRTYS